MPHDVANTTLQADEEAQDPQVESQRAPRPGSLACWFGYTPPCGRGRFGLYSWFMCRGSQLWLGGTGLDLKVAGGGGRWSARVHAETGVLGFRFGTFRLEERVLCIPLHHFLLRVHGGFVETFRLEVLIMQFCHGLLGSQELRSVLEAMWKADLRGVRDHIKQHGIDAVPDESILGRVARGTLEDPSFNLKELPCRKTPHFGGFRRWPSHNARKWG